MRRSRPGIDLFKMATLSACILFASLLQSCSDPREEQSPLYEYTFDGWDSLEDWTIEGTGTAMIADGLLTLQEEPDGVGVVAWSNREFPDSVRISMQLEFSESTCIGVIFFAAHHNDDKSFPGSSGTRSGAYDEYIRGDVQAYGLSLHRYWPDGRNNPGSNLRRNPGFHLLDQANPDPMLASRKPYDLQIEKWGTDIRVFVDDALTHRAVDNGESGPPYSGGHLGIRLRGAKTCKLKIDDVTVESLSGDSD